MCTKAAPFSNLPTVMIHYQLTRAPVTTCLPACFNLNRHTQAYYKFLSHMHPFRNDNALLSDMVPSLRREVLMHMNQDLIESVPIFKFGTLGFQAAVVALIEPAFCLAEQYLIVYGEVHAEMYFLGQGALQTIDRHGYPLNTFEDGTFLGELMVRVPRGGISSKQQPSHDVVGARCWSTSRQPSRCEL